MEEILRQLLDELEAVGERSERLYDTDIRNAMSDAVISGFVKNESGFQLPTSFGFHSEEENKQVGAALEKYISRANDLASRDGMPMKDRLNAFQDSDVKSSGGQYFDDFFGYVRSVEN